MKKANEANEADKAGGIINVYKPSGITSYDVIRQIKRLLKARRGEKIIPSPYPPCSPFLKIGHAGTLDPFADGVLVVLMGEATKRAEQLLHCDKTYRGAICLGVETDTGDPTGRRVSVEPLRQNRWTLGELSLAAKKFVGEMDQVPPMYSALRWGGKRLYELARSGQVVKRSARKVNIKKFEILDYEYPKVSFEAVVSGGTYLRVLASDFARALGTVGHLERLTRTAVGDLKLEDCLRLNELESDRGIQKLLGVPLD